MTRAHPSPLPRPENPYALRRGATLRVRALLEGRPVANQYGGGGGRTARGGPIGVRTARTDADGVAHVALPVAGRWYVKFIRMERVTGDTIDYRSRWATLTSELR
ncbi:MAG TPA: DUF4198 domain-containing protein [Gemmatimonadaceae bacterium]|nr:DUF4198 domain-containing protein [Gemmatimonadaceae bacterium]